MKHRLAINGFLWLILMVGPVSADEASDGLRTAFERRYRDYFGAGSQSLLPFSRIEKADWKKLLETRPMKVVFTAPDRYYNSKVYTLTLYQATDDDSFYLDAKGGFWGMDELAYGPLKVDELR